MACCTAVCVLGAGFASNVLAQSAFDLLASLPRGAEVTPTDVALIRSARTDALPTAPPQAGLSLSLSGRSASALPSLMQVPSEQLPGQFKRPRYALGFQSSAMRRWAKDFGLDAQTCYAPILRARTRLSQDGGLSGSLVMQARCSFH